jgi:hypothetical protein
MTYHDKIFLAGPIPKLKGAKHKPANSQPDDEHGIGRSPRFVPGWWLVATGIFYVAVAFVCILFLT